MRLYTNKSGAWFGTQAEARKGSPRNWVEVDVPTSKQDLINWLNANQVGGGYDQPVRNEPAVVVVDGDAPPEVLSKHAESWVAFALDTILRGDKAEGVEILKKGLRIQKGARE